MHWAASVPEIIEERMSAILWRDAFNVLHIQEERRLQLRQYVNVQLPLNPAVPK